VRLLTSSLQHRSTAGGRLERTLGAAVALGADYRLVVEQVAGPEVATAL